jgi:GNAT superfamily N-acetyltransferase
MIKYTTATYDQDLSGILELQKRNLVSNLTKDEISSQGFVTVSHSFQDIQKMNLIEPHVIAKEGPKVIAYLLAMTKRSQYDIPVLIPMFKAFESIDFKGKRLAAYNFIVIGQACVDKAYRGLGVFDACYQHYAATFRGRYDLAVTEIASSNLRSLRAHKRIGFKTIHQYIAPDSEVWDIVVLDW